jgi:hypothetical protein
VIPVFCVYVNYIHFSFHAHIFSYNFLPLFVLYLLEFQPTFLSTCQVQFLLSVAFPILYLISPFVPETPRLLPYPRKNSIFMYSPVLLYNPRATFVLVICKRYLNTNERIRSNALVETKVDQEYGFVYT